MLFRIIMVLIIITLLATCQVMHGPNYNNSDRTKAMLKEDARMRKAMIRERKRATPKQKHK